MTTITALPSAPSRSTDTPENYVTKADAMMAALPTFVTETNTVAGEVNTNATTATTQATNAATSASTAAANVAFAMRWNFDSSTTMADPGTGDLRLNHATPASVTAIAVSASSADTGNPSVSAAVLTWDDSTTTANRGTLTIRKIGTPGTFAQYQITGATTDNTTWLQLTVAYTAGNGTLSNADSLAVGFVRTGDAGTVSGGNLSSYINFARATVASHATTADIWAAAGNQIDFTGTATVTAFPAAPQAGAERALICAGACAFTAGANMLIDGVSSGNTVTCAANDTVIVRAITTTQFKLSRIKYDGTSQVSGGLAAASQAQSESATDNTVAMTPLNTNWHPGVAKAWLKCGITGNILGSHNVASITDNGTGDVTCTYTTAFSSTNYSVVVSIEDINKVVGLGAELTTYVRAYCCNYSSVYADPITWHFVAFGDQS